ncbi:MAG: ABC transporter ATP-binding protein [Thermodesulfobacteriota bacterium]
MDRLLETQDLVTNFYTYEGVVQALNQVSLVVAHGTTFGLVGESGCGKSVTVRSIMRIVPEPGRIEGGRVIAFLDEESREKGVDLLLQSEAYMQGLRGCDISMIFQEPNAALNPTLSIGDQVAESFLFHRQEEMCRQVLEDLDRPGDRTMAPFKAFLRYIFTLAMARPDSLTLKAIDHTPVLRRWRGRLKREALRRSVEILGRLGLPNPDQVVGMYPHNLSGGMKQRIVIAMALACSPVLLIADEATSNLDVTIQAQILDLLRRLKEEVISSILLITHDLGVVAETCDRVGVMYAGNVCEVADVDRLFRRPLHPYTKALLDSVPKFSMEGTLRSIEGNVPNLVEPPPGCRFHPRCPERRAACVEKRPPLLEIEPDHFVACYLYPGSEAPEGPA